MLPDSFSLKTDRLLLRPVILDDAVALHHVTDDKDILSVVDFLPEKFDTRAAQELISSQNPTNRFLVICNGETGTLLGLFGLHGRDDDKVEIGYWLGKDSQGKGLASEVLSAIITWTQANHPDWTLIAECRPANLASMKLLLKHGFVETGMDGQRAGRKILQLTS